MKMKALFTAAMLFGAVASMNAQSESYNRLTVGYDCNTFCPDGGDSYSLNGFALQYTQGKQLGSKPVFLEYGARLSMGFWSEEEKDDDCSYKSSLTKMSLTIPVSVGYKLDVSEGFSVMPYTGLHLIGNIIGSNKEEESYSAEYKKWGAEDVSETVSMFDKDKVGDDAKWNRFQFGWQIGANISYQKFNLGVEYSLDFNEICKKVTTSDLLVTVGYVF